MTDSHAYLPDDEPKTPMWLPALGGALFVAVALWWAVTPSALPIAADPEAPGASASVAAIAPPPPAAQPPPNALPMAGTRPVPSGVHMDPRIEDRMRKLHEGMDLKGTGKHP